MRKPVVAIIGRPNVGKSTLFNKLIGKRYAIVDDTPGVTRDRIYADCDWNRSSFLLVDTGGIEPKTDSLILEQMRMQAQLAIAEADVIVFITDVTCGVTANDQEISSMLKKSGTPVLLCVNKVDSTGNLPAEFYEFYNLGLGDPCAVSATHGLGTGDLLDLIVRHLPAPEADTPEEEIIHVALLGKPNVGKSSLINRILGSERMIVSDIPGTTRDAVDSPVENQYGKFMFIDTAGLRRKSRITDAIEKYSVMRSQLAIERSEVCILMIDAQTGFTEQDSKIAGEIVEKGRACIIAVNKWDAVEKETKTMETFRAKLMKDLSFMSYAPIIFISAKTGQRIDRLFSLIQFVNNQHAMRIPTGRLNDVMAEAITRVQPPSDKGKRLKLLYITQPSTRPPTFVIFCNRIELFHFSYQRYIENQIRKVFGLEGTPMRFILRERDREGTK